MKLSNQTNTSDAASSLLLATRVFINRFEDAMNAELFYDEDSTISDWVQNWGLVDVATKILELQLSDAAAPTILVSNFKFLCRTIQVESDSVIVQMCNHERANHIKIEYSKNILKDIDTYLGALQGLVLEHKGKLKINSTCSELKPTCQYIVEGVDLACQKFRAVSKQLKQTKIGSIDAEIKMCLILRLAYLRLLFCTYFHNQFELTTQTIQKLTNDVEDAHREAVHTMKDKRLADSCGRRLGKIQIIKKEVAGCSELGYGYAS